MKSTRYYLILSLLTIIMMRYELVYANSSYEFKDQIIKDDNFYIIAETEKETLLEYKHHAFQAHYDPYTLADYCKKIGGTATISDSDIETSFINLVEMKNVTCSHTSGKGFVAKLTKARLNPYWIYVKHDETQALGYALKQKLKDDHLDQYKTAIDLVFERTNYYLDYGVVAEYCALKGGKYLISNEDTYGYAVDMTTYYMNVAKSVGNFITPELPGNRWCIDTSDPKDQFSMLTYLDTTHLIPGTIYDLRNMHIVPTMGVDLSQIKYSTKPVPPYMMDKDQYIAMEENKTLPIYPSKELMDLAEKTLDAQTSSSITYAGKLYEGLYLGQKTDGCLYAAVWTTPVQLSDQVFVYTGKYQADQILNFKRCDTNELEYIGESIEKHIPLDIFSTIYSKLNACMYKKIQFADLGYDISCQYQSMGPELYFEIEVMRKDRFVGKYYILMGIKDDRTLKEKLRDRFKSVFF